MTEAAKTEEIARIIVGTETFSLASLSEVARKLIGFLASQVDLVELLGSNPEEVWQVCESRFGPLTASDKATLITLYELFIGSSAITLVPGGKVIHGPFNCWVDCQNPH